MSKVPNVLLIDGNALIHRAWHALPHMTSPDGRVVNAVYGFASILINVMESRKPLKMIVCWDTPEPTFRHIAEPTYKAQREEQPQAFYDQFPLAKQMTTVLGGTNVELPGYEADDLLGTLAKKFSAIEDVEILTSDKDCLQLVGPRVSMIAFKKGVTELIEYTEKNTEELYGLRPDQVVDFKSMRGDASDNLKGIPGIGEKTAMELIQKFGALEDILHEATNPDSKMTPSVRAKLIEHADVARKTKPLVTILRDVPISKRIEFPDVHRDESAVVHLYTELGFKSLLKRMNISEHAVELSSTRRIVSSGKMLSDWLQKSTDSMIAVQCIKVAQEDLFGSQEELVMAMESESIGVTREACMSSEGRQALQQLFQRSTQEIVGRGMKDVAKWMEAHGIHVRAKLFDLDVASYILHGGESSSAITSIEQAISIAKKLKDELQKEKMDHVYDRFEAPLIPVLARMEGRGILIDRPYFAELKKEFSKEKTSLEAEMMQMAGTEFNPASPSQLATVLFETLKLPTKGIKKGKTGLSTAAPELEKLEGLHPIIEKISEYREIAKLLSTYVETLPVQADADGRVHTTYNQALTATGRLSSSNPNLQNIPIRTEIGRKIRKGFIASQGNVFVSCDYSQIELRVIAALAKDVKMIEAFQQGKDIHTATAANIWHVPFDEVTKDQRRAAKAINFGIIYGQGPQGLARSAGVSFDEAKMFIAEYFSVYSGIKTYLDDTKDLVRAQGYVETLFGRRREIPDIDSPAPQIRAMAERMAINMPAQGTAADLLKLAMVQMDQELSGEFPDAKLLLQVHDEVVWEVPEADSVALSQRICEIMEHVEKIGCPLVGEAKIGKNWEEMTKV